MQEEQMKILDMVANGKISAQEGAALLEALNAGGQGRRDPRCEWPPHHPHWPGHTHCGEHSHWERWDNGRLLRIRVSDDKSEQPLVNLSLPLSVLKWKEKMGKAFSRKFKNIFFDVENIDEKAEGKIVEAVDEKSGKKVEIWVE